MQRCAAARGSGNDACADGSCSHTPCVIVALQTRCSERRLQNALPRVQLMLDRHCCLQKLRGWRTGTGALPNLPVYVAKAGDLAFRSIPPYCPRGGLCTLRSCRCCPCIALQADRSVNGPQTHPSVIRGSVAARSHNYAATMHISLPVTAKQVLRRIGKRLVSYRPLARAAPAFFASTTAPQDNERVNCFLTRL